MIRRRRRFAVLGLALLLMAAAGPSAGDTRMQAIMRTKLTNTQALLKAIVTTDYKEIDRAASALTRISEMEIVSWQNPPKREYTDQAMIFMSTVDELSAAAKRRDIEAVGAEYSTLVTTCIHCHAYVRDARVASLMFPTLAPMHSDRGARRPRASAGELFESHRNFSRPATGH